LFKNLVIDLSGNLYIRNSVIEKIIVKGNFNSGGKKLIFKLIGPKLINYFFIFIFFIEGTISL
jgi:hypothetical protein